MSDLKTCKKCKAVLPASEYYSVKRGGKEWPMLHCKSCQHEMVRDWVKRHREEDNKYRREWAQRDRKRDREKVLQQELKRGCKKYGVTVEWYKEQHEKQHGLCALCLQPERSWSKPGGAIRRLAIDHCHTSLRVRGLLCSACNQAVGMIDAAPGWLERATEYLKET
jgi:hypothetical protein